MQEQRIAIVGAGPAGLTAALAAHRLGFDVTVFEQAEEFRRVGGGILMHSNGLRVLAALGLLDGFLGRVRPIQRLHLETADGRSLSTLDYSHLTIPNNHAALALRADLQAYLLSIVHTEGIPVHFSHRLVGLIRAGGRAQLRFENERTDTFEVVIAADGIHSRTRDLAGMTTRRIDSGEAYLRGISAIDLRNKSIREIWGGDGRRFGICPMTADRTYFYCTVPRGSRDKLRADVAERERWIQSWENFPAEVTAVLSAADDWSTITYSEPADIVVDRWHRAPVFLIGDAAHAMTPNLGQGANSAMVDALVLARLLAETLCRGGTLAEAGSAFEALRRPFVTRTQAASRQAGSLARWTSPPARLLRGALFRTAALVPEQRRSAALLAAGYNPPEEPYIRRIGEYGKL